MHTLGFTTNARLSPFRNGDRRHYSPTPNDVTPIQFRPRKFRKPFTNLKEISDLLYPLIPHRLSPSSPRPTRHRTAVPPSILVIERHSHVKTYATTKYLRNTGRPEALSARKNRLPPNPPATSVVTHLAFVSSRDRHPSRHNPPPSQPRFAKIAFSSPYSNFRLPTLALPPGRQTLRVRDPPDGEKPRPKSAKNPRFFPKKGGCLAWGEKPAQFRLQTARFFPFPIHPFPHSPFFYRIFTTQSTST